MSRETQQSVNAWAVETFGDGGTHLQCANRANQEMSELLTCLAGTEPSVSAVAEELADVCIVLYRLGVRLGVELSPVRLLAPDTGWYGARCFAAEANHYLANTIGYLSVQCGERLVPTTLHGLWQELRCVAEALELDLQAAIDAKMQTNRQREWAVDDSGHGTHVKGGAA